MFKKFSTKQLIFLALMATLLLIVNLFLGGWLIAISGIPMANMVLTGITFGLFLILAIQILPRFGTITLVALIYAILEMPTPLGGAPGFWPKIPINVLTGLAGDLFLYYFNYKKWAHFIGFYVLIIVNTLAFIYFMSLFGLPNVSKLVSMLWWVLPLYFVLGTIGIILGIYIYNKIKNKQIIKQLRN